jgi:hypothetical protein
MPTWIRSALLVPLLLLTPACADQLLTAPEEALLSISGETVNYRAILLEGGTHGIAFDINDAGVVVGIDKDSEAVRWIVSSAGVSGPQKLGTLPTSFRGAQFAVAVNAGGTIVGWTEAVEGVPLSTPTQWECSFCPESSIPTSPKR